MHLSCRIILICLVSLTIWGLSPVSGAASDKDHIRPDIRTLESASELDYPPFCLVRKDGSADGFSVELLKAVANIAGLDIRFEVAAWHEIKQQLIDGKIDVLPFVSYSEEREQVYDFTAPYLRLHGTIFVRKGETSIHTEADLKDKEVLVMRGDTAHEYATKKKLSNYLILTESFEQAMRLLSSGRHDAVIIQQLAGTQLVKQLNLSNLVDVDSFRDMDLKIKDKPLQGFEQKFCIAVKEGDKELLARLNEGLAIVFANGTYDDLYDKWLSPILPHAPVNIKLIAKYVFLILIPILFILGILGIWFLKREIALKTEKLTAQMDMTRQNEEHLRRERNFLDRIMETSPTGIVHVDVSGKIVYANERAEEILGMRFSEDIAKTYDDPAWKITDFYGQIVPVENLPFNIVKNTHNPVYDIQHAIIWPDGRRVFLSINAAPLFESDTFDGMVAIIDDITDQIALENRVSQAQKMESIGTLAGGIAHDFNNILFPIIGYTEMLLEDVSKDSPLRDSLNQIYGSTLRARDLVAQILAFSRQGKNEVKLMKMQPIINEVLKLIRSTIPATISIHQDLQADCGLVEADPTRIHQIVMNLTTNAYHAMQENGGKLDVTLKQIRVNTNELTGPDMVPGLYACLIIADTGTGMDKQTMDKIFDPFFTTKEQGKGTGMGLSVVHGIVKSMNGAIKVYSESGKGSKFQVFLPITQSICDMPEKREKTILQGGTETLMLIDDEKSIVTVEKNALERLGYQVISFENSFDALMAFRSDPDLFDMVISDIAMPNMPGDKLAAELIKIRPDIPILLCTGFSENMSEEKIASIGVRGFLLKPIIIKDLATKIRQILDDPFGGVHMDRDKQS